MKLTAQLKKLILQPVHCTGYLSQIYGNYRLEHNEYDNKWYFKKKFSKDNYAGVATDNISSWKHNRKYELKEKEFAGVVVKIDRVLISTLLGTYKRAYGGEHIYSCNFAPSRQDGCSVLAATVFFRNGCKRIVPLDCIKESEDFSNGKETRRIMTNLEQLISEDVTKNVVTVKPDGIIEIENSYIRMNPETAGLLNLKRYLVLDVRNRRASCYAEEGNEWFNISDDEYNQIMDVMNSQMKEDCGFVPDLSYRETNFDRLVNFARFSFAPVLNKLCVEEILGNKLNETESDLKNSPDCVKKFIQLTGLPYTPKINKILLQGHRNFAEYFSICSLGFKDEKLIEKLMDEDKSRLFAAASPYSDNLLFKADVSFLFMFYDEKTLVKLISEQLYEKEYYTTDDCLSYMKMLSEAEELSQDVINKIGKEGFTEYNHNLLMRIWRDLHPSEGEQFENEAISYSDEEKNLEWENAGYKFCLPENTDRLVDIGSKMNICVGHLYRDKAVNKECTIVYAQKDDEYELCIEVNKHNNRFRLVQKSAFNNSVPKGQNMTIFKQWCRVKGVS